MKRKEEDKDERVKWKRGNMDKPEVKKYLMSHISWETQTHYKAQKTMNP